MNSSWIIVALIFWIATWALNQRLARMRFENNSVQTSVDVFIPILFGAALLMLWEGICRGFSIPTVLLPPPSMIWARITSSVDILWADFQQTYLKAVLAGYAIGCGSGFVAAIIVDRIPFLRKGLLPVGNLVAALPIVGMAPIMVMWFGFDWPLKSGCCGDHDLLPHVGEYGFWSGRDRPYRTRFDAHLRVKLLADASQSAPACGNAVYF